MTGAPPLDGPSGDSTAATPPAPHRVLVVDDNRDAADTLLMYLELAGYEGAAVYDGAQAIELAATLRPHAVLLDIGMPGLDGYEVARRLRQAHGAGGLFLAALTGWGQQADRQAARDAGFDLHLTKPVDPVALAQLLDRTLGARDG